MKLTFACRIEIGLMWSRDDDNSTDSIAVECFDIDVVAGDVPRVRADAGDDGGVIANSDDDDF